MLEYLISDKSLGLIVEGSEASESVREIIGETRNWSKDSLRYKYAIDMTCNAFHSSRKEDAELEIQFFKDNFNI